MQRQGGKNDNFQAPFTKAKQRRILKRISVSSWSVFFHIERCPLVSTDGEIRMKISTYVTCLFPSLGHKLFPNTQSSPYTYEVDGDYLPGEGIHSHSITFL